MSHLLLLLYPCTHYLLIFWFSFGTILIDDACIGSMKILHKVNKWYSFVPSIYYISLLLYCSWGWCVTLISNIQKIPAVYHLKIAQQTIWNVNHLANIWTIPTILLMKVKSNINFVYINQITTINKIITSRTKQQTPIKVFFVLSTRLLHTLNYRLFLFGKAIVDCHISWFQGLFF
jgi:hypothetical protein